MPDPVRLVLVMGGGVSLGSYAAGALTELFYALDQVTNKSSGPPSIQIDVITGASAGAMSAAVFARALTADSADIQRLHDAWVERISITELTRRGATGFDPLALLSSAAIEKIADDVLTVPPLYDWRPFCNRPLRLAFTLTNLGGMVYPLSYANDVDSFFSTRIHSDHVRFNIDNNAAPDPATWKRIRGAAVASGAFPAAFPPRVLARGRTEFRNALWPDGAGEFADMWYVDGGVLDNEPLGLAKALVEEDDDHIHHDYRYVLIDPYLNPALAAYDAPDTLVRALGGLARAVLGESTAKDWIRANKLNWRLGVLEEFVARHLRPIVDAVAASAGPRGAGILAALDAQARGIARFKKEVNRQGRASDEAVADYLEENLERIRTDPRFAPGVTDLDGGTLTAMLQAIFILENFAGLRHKERMPLYLIAPGAAPEAGDAAGPDPHPLAGDFLHNFGGFFRREWREHDFLCGRRDARAVLTRDLRAGGHALFDYPPEPGVDYSPVPIAPGPEDLTREEVRHFRDYFKDRFEAILEPRVPWYAGWAEGLIAGVLADRALEQIGIDT